MSDLPMDELMNQAEQLVAMLCERGYSHADPLYTLFFFSSTHLPAVRFTPDGLYDVKQKRILVPARRLRS